MKEGTQTRNQRHLDTMTHISTTLAFGSDGVSDESHDPHRDETTHYTPRKEGDRSGPDDEDDG